MEPSTKYFACFALSLGGTCSDLSTDEGNCGGCDNECDHDRTCTGGSCTCNGYTLPSSCGGCGSWTFETGSTEGWGIDTENPSFSSDWNAVSNVIQSQTREHGGSYSVAATFLVDTDTHQVSAMTPLCTTSGGAMNIGGFTLSFWAYYTSAQDLMGVCGSQLHTADGRASHRDSVRSRDG